MCPIIMSEKIHFFSCPVCGSAAIQNVLSAMDHTVSGETFRIDECRSCTLRFTQDTPGGDGRQHYYKSENYISHTNTSKGWINRMYLMIRNRTMKTKRRLIERISGLRNGLLLDVGSGTGTFVNTMREHGWMVTGLEPDADARAIANKNYKLQLLDENEMYNLPHHSFDIITLWHVLEHVDDLTSFLKQARQLLKDSGSIFIAVPNYTSYDAGDYKNSWAAYDVPRHLYHFSPKSMKVLVEKNGMKIEKYRPMWYDSFYISLLSSKNKNKTTRWATALWYGMVSNIRALFNVKKCSSVIYVVRN